MDKVLAFLALLAVAAVAILVAPIGLAVYETWGPAQTNGVLTGGFSICGGAVALAGLGLGLVAGVHLIRDRRERRDDQQRTYQVSAPQQRGTEFDYWRVQKAMLEAERARVVLQREQQALLPQPAAQPTEQRWEDWVLVDSQNDLQGAESPW